MKSLPAIAVVLFAVGMGVKPEHAIGQTGTLNRSGVTMRKFLGGDGKPPEVGDDGYLPSVRVVKVLDESNLLGEISVDVGIVRSPTMPGGYMDQKREVIWLVTPTAGMTDNREVEIRGYYKVTGTKTYGTVTGGRATVLMVELNDVQPPDPRVAAAQAAAKAQQEEAKRQERMELAKWRTWTSADGKHRTEAKFVAFISGILTLEKSDGKQIKVQLDQLAAEDQEFVRERKWTKPDEMTEPPKPPQTPPAVAADTPRETPGKPKPPADVQDGRVRWLNTSYNSTIYHVDGKQWAEKLNTTGELKWHFDETGRTPEYIELFNTTRKETTRLFAKRMDVQKGNSWSWVSNGHWDKSTAPAP